MAGANQIYGAGMIESGVTFDFGQLSAGELASYELRAAQWREVPTIDSADDDESDESSKSNLII